MLTPLRRVAFLAAVTCAVTLASLLPANHWGKAAGDATIALTNGDFETGDLSGWTVCGGSRVVDRPAGGPPSFATNNAKAVLALAQSSAPACTYYFVESTKFWQAVDIPADASRLVVSFWHYVKQRVPGPQAGSVDLTAQLLPRVDATVDAVQVGTLTGNMTSGWNRATLELNPANLATVRGKRMFLSFRVGVSLFDTPPEYYLDNIQVHTTSPQFTVPEQALPDDLKLDKSKPIVGIQYTAGNRNIVRINPDGSGMQTIFSTANFSISGATAAVWSPDGQKIAVGEHAAQEDPVEFLSDRARISVMHLMGSNGESRRELFRTFGQPVTPGDPRGCTYPRTDCRREEINALDVQIESFEWSPDSQKLLTKRCVRQRWSFGYVDDATCTRVMRNAASGAEEGALGQSNQLGNWGAGNKLLFSAFLDSLRAGIYELNMAAPTISPTLVYSHYSNIVISDWAPIYFPDNRHFLTLRRMHTFWYNDQGALGGWRYSFMRFDKQDIQNPEQLLYVDHVKDVLAWDISPDGRYVVYAATDFYGATDLWWLRVSDGATGRITSGSNIATVSWRKTGGPPSVPVLPKAYIPLARR